MLELILAFLLCAVMAKVADADGLSGIIWGCITFVIALACLLIPIPFLRLGVAMVLVFAAMLGYKMVAQV